MKKLLLLLCGVMLCFCACQTEQAAEPAPEKRLPPDRELTMEEALEYAIPLATDTLADEMMEDLELAEETHEGYYYLMNFVVVGNDADKDYVWSRLDSPISPIHDKKVDFLLYLPEEERVGIEYGDVLQVVGKISFIGVSEKLHRTATMMELTDAHCVTKIFQVTGEILENFCNYDGVRYLILMDESDSVLPDSEIIVYLQEEGGYTAGDRITATGALCWDRRSVSGKGLPSWVFCMDEPESIEKN